MASGQEQDVSASFSFDRQGLLTASGSITFKTLKGGLKESKEVQNQSSGKTEDLSVPIMKAV